MARNSGKAVKAELAFVLEMWRFHRAWSTDDWYWWAFHQGREKYWYERVKELRSQHRGDGDEVRFEEVRAYPDDQ
jgi:hypothetical protein